MKSLHFIDFDFLLFKIKQDQQLVAMSNHILVHSWMNHRGIKSEVERSGEKAGNGVRCASKPLRMDVFTKKKKKKGWVREKDGSTITQTGG